MSTSVAAIGPLNQTASRSKDQHSVIKEEFSTIAAAKNSVTGDGKSEGGSWQSWCNLSIARRANPASRTNRVADLKERWCKRGNCGSAQEIVKRDIKQEWHGRWWFKHERERAMGGLYEAHGWEVQWLKSVGVPSFSRNCVRHDPVTTRYDRDQPITRRHVRTHGTQNLSDGAPSCPMGVPWDSPGQWFRCLGGNKLKR